MEFEVIQDKEVAEEEVESSSDDDEEEEEFDEKAAEAEPEPQAPESEELPPEEAYKEIIEGLNAPDLDFSELLSSERVKRYANLIRDGILDNEFPTIGATI